MKPGRPSVSIDWDQMEQRYVTSQILLTELGKQFDVSYGSMRRHCQNDKWDEKRKKFKREKLAIEKKVIAEEVETQARSRFRSSEEIRGDHHLLANAMARHVEKVFLDPKTKKPRVKTPRVTSRQLKEYAEVQAKTYELEMGTAGHAVAADTVNLNARVFVAGVAPEQLQAMDDAALEQVLEVAARARALPAKDSSSSAEEDAE